MAEPTIRFSDDDRQALREVARASIAHGLTHRQPLPVHPAHHSPVLQQKLAVFITLYLHHALRGCIGNTRPVASLVEDTAANAFAAAFRDPRFPPVREHEYARLHVTLSVLTPPVPLHVPGEQELLQRLRVGVDGLVLTTGRHQATFLPSVWETLKDPKLFLTHLKMKAGLAPDAWPDDLHLERYEAITI